jgi:hypothetical protein
MQLAGNLDLRGGELRNAKCHSYPSPPVFVPDQDEGKIIYVSTGSNKGYWFGGGESSPEWLRIADTKWESYTSLPAFIVGSDEGRIIYVSAGVNTGFWCGGYGGAASWTKAFFGYSGAYIGKEDIQFWDGVTSTFTRTSPVGVLETLHKPCDAYVDVLAVYGGCTQLELQAAQVAVGPANHVAIWLSPGIWKISTAFTQQANITLVLATGAILTKIGVGTVNHNNAPVVMDASQHYSGFSSGDVTGLTAQPVNVKWWGANAAAINCAIRAASGGELEWPAGTYSPISAISVTLTGKTRWTAKGPVTIEYGGPTSIAALMTLELGGFDCILEEQLTIDGNYLVGTLLRINNDVDSMANAANLIMSGIRLQNAYSDTNGRNSFGVFIYGAFNQIVIDRPYVYNISRAAGLAGTPATQGLSITNKSLTSYVRTVSITDPYVDTVTSEDAVEAPTYVDMDAIAVIGPSAAITGVKADTSLIVRGGTFINCHGRCVKSQMESNLIDGPTIIKNASMTKRAMTSAQEIDFQYGSGSAINGKIRYSEIAGGGSPFSASHAIVNASIRGYTTEEGQVVVKNWEVTSNVPQWVDALPYFVTITRIAGVVQSAVVSDNVFQGVGNVEILVLASGANINSIVVNNNYLNDLRFSLVYSAEDYSSALVIANGNRIGGTSRPITSGESFIPPWYGNKNTGFNSSNAGDRMAASSNISDGAAITHSMGGNPTVIIATGTVAGEMVSITAVDATTFTVSIKKHDNTPGTPQTVYWHARR